jgi:hypothetical protein
VLLCFLVQAEDTITKSAEFAFNVTVPASTEKTWQLSVFAADKTSQQLGLFDDTDGTAQTVPLDYTYVSALRKLIRAVVGIPFMTLSEAFLTHRVFLVLFILSRLARPLSSSS